MAAMKQVWILGCLLSLAVSTLRADDTEDADEVSRLRQLYLNVPKRFQLRGGSGGESAFQLVAEPILNWSNPIRLTRAGGMFLWTLDGRPQVALCVYPNNDRYDYEFQSLSEWPLTASVGRAAAWEPAEAGIAFKTLEGAPPPGRSRGQTLLQMRRFVKDFSGKLVPRGSAEIPLRLLPAPVYRYPEQGLAAGYVDGGVFVFVQGTDPEVVLVVEALSGDEPHWQYGLARMSVVPSQITLGEEAVWEVGPVGGNRRGPYYVLPGIESDNAIIEVFE